jgi:SAM-dependent methyltransferase
MTFMLHWAAAGRTFTGYDYDEEKIITAAHNYTLNKPLGKTEGKIKFQYADLTELTLQPCTGIIISDALHYLLPEQQMELLEKCYDALLKDGVLIIRDGVSDLKQRHQGTRWTELFSTRILKFNKTKNELHFLNRPFFENWAKSHGLQLEIRDNSQRTSNLIFVFRKTDNVAML